MRVVFDKDGYVDQWAITDGLGFIPDENEQVIPTPADLDVYAFYDEFRFYHMVDGQLVKDENRKAELEETAKKEKRKLTLQEKIELLVEAFEVDDQPDYKKGFESKPYFDKDRMKFSWKQVAEKVD